MAYNEVHTAIVAPRGILVAAGRQEKLWVSIAFVWCLVLFAMTPLNAVVAVVNFLVGVIAAFGVVMPRWHAVHLMPAELFYRFLTLHGLNMLIFFIIFFEMVVL